MSGGSARDPGAGAGGPKDAPETSCVLGLFTADPEAAEAVVSKLRDSGIDPREVSIVATGSRIERRLIRDKEMNASELVSAREHPDLPLLEGRFASEPKLLLEGCWAIGPLFHPKPSTTLGAQGVESLAKAFLKAGLDIREAAALESALKTRGGLWLGVRGRAPELERMAREVASLPGIDVRVIRVAC